MFQGIKIYAAFLPISDIRIKEIDGRPSRNENPPDYTFLHEDFYLSGDILLATETGGLELSERNDIPGAVAAICTAPHK